MGIGASIFLIAAGLILALAVQDQSIAGVDVPVVGWILVAAGVLGLILTFAFFGPRRRLVARDDVAVDRTVYRDRAPVVEERRVYDDGAPRY
ncbi:DUF6458 family protein [Motilibacter aurantiacus]|uniref:DUF6458 family protein n=1 Tax=Motilibacter aurantiacus TaxID=2714955 RepID=UPI001409A146|nr:hypothetical protein [Motilibacter aurantiacus]